MARPAKNNCDYFPHDAGMRNHKKVKAIRNKFQNGYAIWVMLLEHLTASDGNVFPYSDLEFELMSGDFGFSVTEIRSVVDYCITLEMLFVKDGFVCSESLDERLAPVYVKRGKAKELSKKQLRESGKYVTEIPEDTEVSVTEMPQSKVKESKGNETKVKKSKLLNGATKVATNATIEERQKELMQRMAPFVEQYGKEMLREFFNYWTEMNPGGKKMRFEMQKVFDPARRLVTWSKNNKFKKNGIEGINEQQQRANAIIEARFAAK